MKIEILKKYLKIKNQIIKIINFFRMKIKKSSWNQSVLGPPSHRLDAATRNNVRHPQRRAGPQINEGTPNAPQRTWHLEAHSHRDVRQNCSCFRGRLVLRIGRPQVPKIALVADDTSGSSNSPISTGGFCCWLWGPPIWGRRLNTARFCGWGSVPTATLCNGYAQQHDGPYNWNAL